MDFEKVLVDSLAKWKALHQQIDELHLEDVKLTQFISATINMLPEAKKAQFKELLQAELARRTVQADSLNEAVKVALVRRAGQWLTVADVRDEVIAAGFDFSDYASNPLASISTTLRRLVDKNAHIESTVSGGVTAYRWSGPTSTV